MLCDVTMWQKGRGDISRVRKGMVNKLFKNDFSEERKYFLYENCLLSYVSLCYYKNITK
jgi:hypothetical protein